MAAIFGFFKGLNATVAIFLIIVGGGLVILAAFWSRVNGPVGLTKDGFSIPIDAANRAEQQLQQGKVVDADDTLGIVDTFEAVLSQHGARAVKEGQPPREIAPPQQEPEQEPTAEPPRWRLGRNVQLVDDAVVTIATLTNHERVQVQTEIARMSHPDFREEDDPRAIRAGDQGRSYRVHKVPDSNLRLWYRPLNEDHPETLVVMVIEKH